MSDFLQTKAIMISVLNLTWWIYSNDPTVSFYFPETLFRTSLIHKYQCFHLHFSLIKKKMVVINIKMFINTKIRFFLAYGYPCVVVFHEINNRPGRKCWCFNKSTVQLNLSLICHSFFSKGQTIDRKQSNDLDLGEVIHASEVILWFLVNTSSIS